MIVLGQYVLCKAAEYQENAGVVVGADGRILDVGTRERLCRQYPDEPIRDFGLSAILPGFVNAHTHLECATMNGIVEDVPYATWKSRIVRAYTLMTREDYYDAALIGALDSLRAGITSLADVSATGASLEAMRICGLHGVVYREVNVSRKDQVASAMEAALADIDLWKAHAHGCGIEIGIGSGSLYSTHPLVLSSIAEAAAHGMPVAVHVAGSREEYDFVRYGSSPASPEADVSEVEVYADTQSQAFLPMGVSPLRYALNWGILYVPRVLAIHCVHIDDADIQRLAENKVQVAVCPRSNAKLGCGIAPIERMRDMGVTVGLGTNSPAAADSIDMLEEMRFTLLMERGIEARLGVLPQEHFRQGHEVMSMATIDAAHALGMESEVGSLEVGKRADLVVVDLSPASSASMQTPHAAVIHATSRDNIRMTMVDGRIVYTREDGFLLDVDLQRLRKRAHEMHEKFSRSSIILGKVCGELVSSGRLCVEGATVVYSRGTESAVEVGKLCALS